MEQSYKNINPKKAGRKPKYKGGTKNSTFRIPLEHEVYVRAVINRWLNKFAYSK